MTNKIQQRREELKKYAYGVIGKEIINADRWKLDGFNEAIELVQEEIENLVCGRCKGITRVNCNYCGALFRLKQLLGEK